MQCDKLDNDDSYDDDAITAVNFDFCTMLKSKDLDLHDLLFLDNQSMVDLFCNC